MTQADLTKGFPELYKLLISKKIKSLDFGWRIFQIRFVENLTLHETGEKCFGITDFDQCEILLEPNVSEDLARETLLHEITHVCLETFGCGNYKMIMIDNEDLTTRVSRSFLQFINLNPDLAALVFGIST